MTPEEIAREAESRIDYDVYSKQKAVEHNRDVIVKAIAAARQKDRELLAEARGWLLNYGSADVTEPIRDLVRRIEGRL